MSIVSNGSLNEKGMQYIGSCARLGAFPYCASSAAARSSASGYLRNSSQTPGDPGGSGPDPGALSRSPLHVTDRSPRRFSVPRALMWPEFGVPTVMPYCCWTSGSDAVASMRPNSMGGPAYRSKSGRSAEMATVSVGNFSGDRARTVPVAAGIGAPSLVTRRSLTPLYTLARSTYACTSPRQVI
jgi:hypothetical protein